MGPTGLFKPKNVGTFLARNSATEQFGPFSIFVIQILDRKVQGTATFAMLRNQHSRFIRDQRSIAQYFAGESDKRVGGTFP